VIHLYAFTRPDTPVPGGLQLHALDDLAAVVGDAADVAAGRDGVVAHGLVVEELREAGAAVLPVRFGERFDDLGALERAVRPRAASLAESLLRVEGCAEYGVRIAFAADRAAPPDASDGTGYMQARLATLGRADSLLAELHEPLTSVARAAVVAPGVDHAAAYLVRDGDRPRFERAVAGFMAAHPDVTVVCTGPWAPYSFAS
jgi:putative intracellular protease/amidase